VPPGVLDCLRKQQVLAVPPRTVGGFAFQGIAAAQETSKKAFPCEPYRGTLQGNEGLLGPAKAMHKSPLGTPRAVAGPTKHAKSKYARVGSIFPDVHVRKSAVWVDQPQSAALGRCSQ
jgi:hypothetical protein